MTYIYKPNKNRFGPFFGDRFYYPPYASSFTMESINPLIPSKEDILGGLLLKNNYSAGISRNTYLINAPSPPYTLTACMVPYYPFQFNGGSYLWGLCFKTTSGYYEFYLQTFISTTVHTPSHCELYFDRLSGLGSIIGGSGWNYAIANIIPNTYPYMWLSITDLGSGNLQAGIGQDSRYMQTFDLASRTIFGSAPTQIGIIMQNALNPSSTMGLVVQSWKIDAA